MTEMIKIESTITSPHSVTLTTSGTFVQASLNFEHLVKPASGSTLLISIIPTRDIPFALKRFVEQATQIPGVVCAIVDQEDYGHHFEIIVFGDDLDRSRFDMLFALEYDLIVSNPHLTFNFHFRESESLPDRSIVEGSNRYVLWRNQGHVGQG